MWVREGQGVFALCWRVLQLAEEGGRVGGVWGGDGQWGGEWLLRWGEEGAMGAGFRLAFFSCLYRGVG